MLMARKRQKVLNPGFFSKLRICDAWSFILDQRSLHLLNVYSSCFSDLIDISSSDYMSALLISWPYMFALLITLYDRMKLLNVNGEFQSKGGTRGKKCFLLKFSVFGSFSYGKYRKMLILFSSWFDLSE